MANHASVMGDRNGARFLRDDHCDSIALFADTQRGTVSCAQVTVRQSAVGKGQDHGGSNNFILTDDHGTIVQRRVGIENGQ